MVERQLISLSSQLQLLDRLQHLTYIRSSLILICADQGAGKTTIAELLFNKLPNDHQQLFIALAEPLSDTKIRTQIITQLYKQPLFDADDSLLNSISLLQQKQDKNEATVIVLDNAELLSERLLIELAQLVRDKGNFTENEINIILLVDENKIKSIVAMISELPGSRYIEFKVEPLSKDEASQLLKHLFNQSDYSPQLEHQDALSRQLITCVGLPKNIIRLADNICNGEELKKPALWLKTMLPAISVMLLLLLISGAIIYTLYPQFTKQEPISTVTQEMTEDQTPLLDEITESSFTEQLAGQWIDKKNRDIEANLLSVGIADESTQRTIISEQQILAVIDAEKEQLSLVQNETITSAIKDPISPSSAQNVIPSLQLVTVEEQIEPLLTEEVVAIEEVKNIELSTSSIENQTVQTTQQKLLAVPATYYTLQLLGMSNKKSVQEFSAKYNLPQKNITIYQTIHNNKPWYVVIYGQYENRSAALQASKNLPESFAKMKSWIKTYQIVHQDLEVNHE